MSLLSSYRKVNGALRVSNGFGVHWLLAGRLGFTLIQKSPSTMYSALTIEKERYVLGDMEMIKRESSDEGVKKGNVQEYFESEHNCENMKKEPKDENIKKEVHDEHFEVDNYPARERRERAGHRPERSLRSRGCYSKKYTPHTLWRSWAQP